MDNNVNDADLMSLKSPNWLTDQVLDAYLSYLAQKEWDKGKKEKHLGVSKMTSIINDHVQSSEKSAVLWNMTTSLVCIIKEDIGI